MKFKKILAISLSIIFIFSMAACSDEYDEDEEYDYETEETYDKKDDYDLLDDEDYYYESDVIPEGDVDSINGVSMSVDNSTGALTVSRLNVEKSRRSDDGIWTIFIYLCGTDLETDSGMAVDDMDEMASATHSDNVRFIVETGGTDEWSDTNISDEKIQRFIIQNGEISMAKETASDNMGKAETLADFLEWGTKEYNSEHMGLILWNHGGGSITGVCFDEKYDQDSLTLMEIDAALMKCSANSMGRKFDFIGFDACLMGTIEIANVLATYADYMFSSQEMEPGSGWDYTSIGNYLAKNPDADTVSLGKEVCDSFYKACESVDDEDLATLAVIDLSKIDSILIGFNNFAKDMYEKGEDQEIIAEMVRGIESADNFGGNNKTEGYTNMVDMGGIIEACSKYADGAREAKKALEDAVVYKISGSTHPEAEGLSIYYPLEIQGSNELSLFSKMSVSPYYLSFIDRLNKTAATGYEFEEYEDDQWFEDSEDWNWWDAAQDDDYWNYLDDYEETGESPYITFSEEPVIGSDGSFGFTLDEEGMSNAAGIYALIYELSEDEQEILEIGETVDILGDWDTGQFSDNFDGYWLSLPDGQNLATYIVEETEDYVVYTSPVMYNGEETNLRIKQYYSDAHVEVEGIWNGISEYGAASREIIKLSNGDTVAPIYYAYSLEDDDESMYQGEEYTVAGKLEISYDIMPAGDYYYAFCIDDIYGDYYITDVADFIIDEDGNISFFEY